MTASTLIRLHNLSAAAGPTPVLHDITWQIRPGENWIITGPMGAGKTMLARCLTGGLRVTKGTLSFPFLGDDKGYEARKKAIHLASFSDTSRLFRGPNAVHYYQQRYNAFDSEGHLTVRQYLEHSGFSEKNPEHQAAVEQIGIGALLDLERIKLSSGQTRKMLIARAILGQPRVLMLDNPYIGLDRGARQTFNELIDHLAFDEGMTIILSGHYQELPECITHRIHLEKGKVKAMGTLEEMERVITPAEPVIDNNALAEIKEYYRSHRPDNKFNAIVRLEDVNVGYGKKKILRDLSWTVRPGEKWMLFGPNGAGKSTLLSLIYGDNPQAYANRIYLFDRRRGSGESIWDIKNRIGFTSSELHAYFDHQFTARDVVLSGLWDGFVQRRAAKEQADFAIRLLRYYNLEKHASTPFKRLSTGAQRLLFLLRALIKCPELLLLDEPFQGFDRKTVELSRILLSEILTEKHTLIFITHYEQEVPEVVDRVFQLDS